MGYAFISYSTKQQKDADALRYLLHQNDINTWMAPYDIPDGNEYGDVINRAIQNAACVVLILTEDAQNSIYVDKEIERALHYGKTIAPIQLDQVILNDSFSFYLCNQQILMVSSIDASAPKVQGLLQHLQFLCNDRLPVREAPLDASRDKRVRRQRISRFFSRGGAAGLFVSLFCGQKYIYYAARGTYEEFYSEDYIPELPEIAWTYVLFFSLAIVTVLAFLYGCGLRDPQKKSWNFLRIVSPRWLLPAFSAICSIGSAMFYFAQRAVAAIIRGREAYGRTTAEYILPQWVNEMMWIFAGICIVTALLSVILAVVRDKRNGFAFAKHLRDQFRMIINRRKRGGK